MWESGSHPGFMTSLQADSVKPQQHPPKIENVKLAFGEKVTLSGKYLSILIHVPDIVKEDGEEGLEGELVPSLDLKERSLSCVPPWQPLLATLVHMSQAALPKGPRVHPEPPSQLRTCTKH